MTFEVINKVNANKKVIVSFRVINLLCHISILLELYSWKKNIFAYDKTFLQ